MSFNLLKFAEGIGETALSVVAPGIAGPAIAAINALLPGDKQLPATATGNQITAAAQDLTPEQRTQLEQSNIEADVQHDHDWTQRFQAMQSGTQGWAWVRPLIVLMFAAQVEIIITLYAFAIFNAALNNQTQTISSLTAAWVAVAGAIALPIAIIRSWFGFREQSKHRMAQMASSQTLSPAPGLLSTIIGAIKG